MVDVSVILPVYNIKDTYLRKCLNSLLNQTKREIEIILIDDGSINNALAVCKEYEKKDHRIRVIHQDNQGVSVARNIGLEKASGDWICFVDPDDWVSEEYIELLYQVATKFKADLVQCDCYVYYSEKKNVNNKFLDQCSGTLDLNLKNQLIQQIISKSLADYYPPEVACGTPWAKMYKRSFLNEKGIKYIPGMIRMQDTVFSLYGIQESNIIYYLSKPLYHYRKEIGSASYRYNPQIVKCFERYFDEVDKFLERYNRGEDEINAFSMKKLTSVNSYILYYFFNKSNNMSLKEKKLSIGNLMSQEPYKGCLDHIYGEYLQKSEKVFVYLLKTRQYTILSAITKIRAKVKL